MNELQNRKIEITQSEQQGERLKNKSKECQGPVGLLKKRSNIHVIRVPEERRKQVELTKYPKK